MDYEKGNEEGDPYSGAATYEDRLWHMYLTESGLGYPGPKQSQSSQSPKQSQVSSTNSALAFPGATEELDVKPEDLAVPWQQATTKSVLGAFQKKVIRFAYSKKPCIQQVWSINQQPCRVLKNLNCFYNL